MPRSTYYANQKEKIDKYVFIKQRIMAIYEKSYKRKGYRCITFDLKQEGIIINHKTVLKLMNQLGIKSIVRAKKYKSYSGVINPNCKVPNLLKQDFSTTGLNQKWSTDITEFKVLGRKIYLSAIMDMYNKEIIAYTIGFSPKLKLVTKMMEEAFAKKQNAQGVIIQSDQGWHYKHNDYIKMLEDFGAIQSMSKKGCCFDNAVIENFWGTLKSEWFYLKKFDSITHFIRELRNYIHYFNHERNSQVLGYCTPIQFGCKLITV